MKMRYGNDIIEIIDKRDTKEQKLAYMTECDL